MRRGEQHRGRALAGQLLGFRRQRRLHQQCTSGAGECAKQLHACAAGGGRGGQVRRFSARRGETCRRNDVGVQQPCQAFGVGGVLPRGRVGQNCHARRELAVTQGDPQWLQQGRAAAGDAPAGRPSRAHSADRPLPPAGISRWWTHPASMHSSPAGPPEQLLAGHCGRRPGPPRRYRLQMPTGTEAVMMDSFLTLVGNLTADPALGRTPAGTPVCRFRIAANERVFDRVAGQWRDGSVLYLPVICWRRLAENVAASLRRGDPVAVVGRLRQWRDDQQGALTTEVVAEVVAADLSRRIVRLLPPRPKDRDRDLGRGSGPAPPPAAADGVAAPPPAAADGAAAPGQRRRTASRRRQRRRTVDREETATPPEPGQAAGPVAGSRRTRNRRPRDRDRSRVPGLGFGERRAARP